MSAMQHFMVKAYAVQALVDRGEAMRSALVAVERVWEEWAHLPMAHLGDERTRGFYLAETILNLAELARQRELNALLDAAYLECPGPETLGDDA